MYVPIALMTGVAGDFIRPFALVIAASTLTSLAVSFTLTPLLASRFLTPDGGMLNEGVGRWPRLGVRWDAGFEAVGGSFVPSDSRVRPQAPTSVAFGFLRAGAYSG